MACRRVRRRSQGADLASISIRNHQQTVKDFLDWAQGVGLASESVAAAIEIPDIDREEHVSQTKLEPRAGVQLLTEYREGPDRATKVHVTMELLWTVGCRMGGLRALDLRDIDVESGILEFHHRPNTGTPLKKGTKGQRAVGVNDETANVLAEYIDDHRVNTRDKDGPEPVLTTHHCRVALSSLREWCYFATVPCRYQSCPNGKQQPSCDWFKTTGARECPSSRSPHQVRSGSITWQLNQGFPAEKVARRVNASVRVIDEHYDLPGMREEQEQREAEYLDKLSLDNTATKGDQR